MNPSSHPTRRAGFTLIELVVSMAVLTIMLTMVLQITNSARNAVKLTESKSNNDAIARRAFDRISRDLAQIVIRDDARIEFKSNPGNDQISFLTRAKGFTAAGDAGDRDVSLVSYSILYDATAGERLLRGSCGNLFAVASPAALKLDASLPFSAVSPDNLQLLSNNVIRFEVEYLIQGASGVTQEITAPATSQNLRGLVITLVTLDDWGRRAIKPDHLESLTANFTDAATGKQTLKTWSLKRDELAKSGIAGLPKDALQSIRCYQRTFMIQ
jgi:prepilin-type N-terminal cleavage/methylation domain-containing protein